MTSARMNPRWRSEWITPAHSGALAPARNVHARDSLSPVVRNVRRPRRWYAARATCAERGLADAVHLAHLGARFGLDRGDLGLDVDRHGERAGDRCGQVGLLARVAHDEHRLRGEQERRCEQLPILGAQAGAVERRAFRQDRERALERADLGHDLRVARLERLAMPREPVLDALDVGHDQIELDRGEVALGIGLDTAVGERAQHDEDRVGVAQRAEELRAEPFTGLRARRQGEVHELEAGRHDLLRLRHRRQAVEPLVGNGRDPDRGLVLARRREAGERAEEPVRSCAGEPDEPEVFHEVRRLSTTLLTFTEECAKAMSKKTKKRKLRARRNKANHGKKPRAGR